MVGLENTSSPSVTTNGAVYISAGVGNPTQGNGDIDVVLYYTIEDVNT